MTPPWGLPLLTALAESDPRSDWIILLLSIDIIKRVGRLSNPILIRASLMVLVLILLNAFSVSRKAAKVYYNPATAQPC